MRFLVIDRGGTIELPPAEGKALFIKARDWAKEMMDKGVIEVGYALAGEMASMMIYNVNSHEELDDALQDYPLGSYSIFEIYPLSDAMHSFEKAAQTFEQRKPMAA